jgi:hypothetical protein
MIVEPTVIPDVLLITPPRFLDDRGFFSETWNETRFAAALRPPPARRNRPGGNGVASRSSLRPRPIVLAAMPVTRDTAAMPPYPAEPASLAANSRRCRSFSNGDNEAKRSCSRSESIIHTKYRIHTPARIPTADPIRRALCNLISATCSHIRPNWLLSSLRQEEVFELKPDPRCDDPFSSLQPITLYAALLCDASGPPAKPSALHWPLSASPAQSREAQPIPLDQAAT